VFLLLKNKCKRQNKIHAHTRKTKLGDASQSLTRLVELSNGCICCTVKDDLVNALEELIKRSSHALDHIIIETSGLAHPGPVSERFVAKSWEKRVIARPQVVSMLWLDEELESAVKLNGVVTVVDLFHLPTNLRLSQTSDESLCAAQIA
jgi:G3E family GTPase